MAKNITQRKPTKADLLAALDNCLGEMECSGYLADKEAFIKQLRALLGYR